MSCELPGAVADYLDRIDRDEPRAGPEMHALAAHVRRAFETEDLRVDLKQLEGYLGLAKYFPFDDLMPWQKCLTALWDCTYTAAGTPRWDTAFVMLGRGGGKDGQIAFESMCAASPYCEVPRYDVDICAFNEEQGKRPVFDLIEVLEEPKQQGKLNRYFYHTKELVQGRKTKACIRGRTNNPKGRDGMRSGKIIFNEVHTYETYDNIRVFMTGLGKVANPRIGYFTSNGHVNDGPLDDLLARGRRILFDNEPDDGFLPFIFCLPEAGLVHDPQNWSMANPSLPWFPALMRQTGQEYRGWLERPEENGAFLPKRMGLRAGFTEIAVTDYEKILATNRPLPELEGWSCTVGIDYAELSDWAAVNLHFRRGAERFDINHAWVCAKSKTLPRVKAPWKEWARAGHLTVVEDVSIHPDLLAQYIAQAGKRYRIRRLAMDHHRWTLVSESLKKIGWDASDRERVKLVRPSDIMQVEPVIQECFDRGHFCWGDCPPLRWAVNNTKRVRSSRTAGVDTGNFIYAKIEAKSRKTDPFMALVASMTVEDALGDGRPAEIPGMGAFIF